MNPHLESIHHLAERIGRSVRLMEVCGTHTMTAFRSGLRSLLPANVALLSGPGCPVCVTPDEFVDRAIAIARRPACNAMRSIAGRCNFSWLKRKVNLRLTLNKHWYINNLQQFVAK